MATVHCVISVVVVGCGVMQCFEICSSCWIYPRHTQCSSWCVVVAVYVANVPSAFSCWRCLRSTTSQAAIIQCTWTQLGHRAFSVCGPTIWSSLPKTLRCSTWLLISAIFNKNIFFCIDTEMHHWCGFYHKWNTTRFMYVHRVHEKTAPLDNVR